MSELNRPEGMDQGAQRLDVATEHVRLMEKLKRTHSDEAEIERLRMVENRAELLAEDIECLRKCLDDAGVPRDDGHGNTFSMWGRVLRFKNMQPNNAEIERLRSIANEAVQQDAQVRATNADLAMEIERLQKISDNYYALLVEANAREEKLRDILGKVEYVQPSHLAGKINKALDVPHDNSALSARLAQERERIVALLGGFPISNEALIRIRAAIRALGDEA